MNGYYRFEKGLQSLSDIPKTFKEKNRQNIELPNTVWIDDIIVVTRWTKIIERKFS